MRIACPHCQATYEIDASLTDAVFVCHRCSNEFRARNEDESEVELPIEEQLPLFGEPAAPSQVDVRQDAAPTTANAGNAASQTRPFNTDSANAATTDFDGIDTVNYQPDPAWEQSQPQANNHRIWPWLVSVLIFAIVGGFWIQKDHWLDNRWFRSTAINLGLSMEQRDKDWRVIPESVHAQWITRDNQSRALLIEGRVENLLASELPVPKVDVVFFTADHPDQILLSRLHEITLPPSMPGVRHAPFALPDRDIIPIAALGQRGFILLLESLPENTGDFALTARAAK